MLPLIEPTIRDRQIGKTTAMKRTLARRIAVYLIFGVALQLTSVRVARAGGCKVYWTTDASSAKYKVYILGGVGSVSEAHTDLLAGCSVTNDFSQATFKIYKTGDFSSADIRISKDHLPK